MVAPITDMRKNRERLRFCGAFGGREGNSISNPEYSFVIC